MPPINNDDGRAFRKWCPLCGEWKEYSGPGEEEATDPDPMVYCPACGAKLRDSN